MSIVLLSMAANVISCHTSMVGIDKECKEKVIGDLIRQNVPVMYGAPRSWMQGSAFAAPAMLSCAPQTMNYCTGMSAPMMQCRAYTAPAMPPRRAPKARKYFALSPSRRLIKFVDKVKANAKGNVSNCFDGFAECGGGIIKAF